MKLHLASVRGQNTYNDGSPLLRCKIVSVKEKTCQNHAENWRFCCVNRNDDAIRCSETDIPVRPSSEFAKKLLG